MQHWITFLKTKSLHLGLGDADHPELAHAINHELMRVGYVCAQETFEALASLPTSELEQVHRELSVGLGELIGRGEEYQMIYRGFPQSVLNISYEEFVINALIHYWSAGTWRPEDAEYLKREFKREPVEYQEVGLLTETQFNRIFSDLIYSDISLSKFDKRCVDWYIAQGHSVELSRVSFKETASYIGRRLMDIAKLERLPTRDATLVLRMWAAYSGGDEGLKEATRFHNPTRRQRRLLSRTLDQCYNLEDSFKSYREPWLRLLFYLHPHTARNRAAYPQLSQFSELLRDRPQALKTFNAKVEALIAARDPELFTLLSKRPGAFMRRLDHLVRVFGIEAFHAWLALTPSLMQLITIYNHFSGRDQASSGRGAVLASQSQSQVVTYGALEPLSSELVSEITETTMARIKSVGTLDELRGPVYIDPDLYYTPLAINNRALSLSLGQVGIGKTETYEDQETLRMYVHWKGRSDIDLSGFAILKTNEVVKVGWNAHHQTGYLVYSGDNTGLAEYNAEYLDVNTREIPDEVEWIIVEARIYRGPNSFKGYQGEARIGWMSRAEPHANLHWLPQTLKSAFVLQSESRTAYLMAYHPGSRSIVYLDVAMGNSRVSTAQDALRMRVFLESFVSLNTDNKVSWDKLNQGHIIALLSAEVVDTPEAAEVCFDVNTTAEQVSRLIKRAEETSEQ